MGNLMAQPMVLARPMTHSPDAAWNWIVCKACRGKGKLNMLYDGYGRAISEDLCPTCQGKGGFPMYTNVDIDVRMKKARAGFNPRRIG